MSKYKVYRRRRKKTNFSNEMVAKEGREEQFYLFLGTPSKTPPQRPRTMRVYERQLRKKLATQGKECNLLPVDSDENNRFSKPFAYAYDNPMSQDVTTNKKIDNFSLPKEVDGGKPFAYACDNPMSQGVITNKKIENFSLPKEVDGGKPNIKLAQGLDGGLMRENVTGEYIYVNDCIDSKKLQQKPRKKKYTPKVVVDRKPTTPKPPKHATPKQTREKKPKLATPKKGKEKKSKNIRKQKSSSLKEIIRPVTRALDFTLESVDDKPMDFALPSLPNKKRRSKRRRKLNLFTLTFTNMTIKGKKSKKKLLILNWGWRKRRSQMKSSQEVTDKPEVTKVYPKADASFSEEPSVTETDISIGNVTFFSDNHGLESFNTTVTDNLGLVGFEVCDNVAVVDNKGDALVFDKRDHSTITEMEASALPKRWTEMEAPTVSTKIETPALTKRSIEMDIVKEFNDGAYNNKVEASTSNFQNKVTGKRKRNGKTSNANAIHTYPRGRNRYLSKRFMDVLCEGLQSLHINDDGKMIPYQGNDDGKMISYQEDKVKEKEAKPKVALDSESARVWNLLMHIEDDTNEEKENEETEKWWEQERELLAKRVDSFMKQINEALGIRRYTKWNGSVLDSVIGVILTQNVSDLNSSNAFMQLVAKFPSKLTGKSCICNEEFGRSYSQELVTSSTEYDVEGNSYFVNEPELNEAIKSLMDGVGEMPLMQDIEDIALGCTPNGLDTCIGCRGCGTNACGSASLSTDSQCCQEEEMINSQPLDMPLVPTGKVVQSDEVTLRKKIPRAKVNDSSGTGKKKKSKKEEKKLDDQYWENLRLKHSTGQRSRDQMDSVDWEAVRLANLKEVADVIAPRGQQNRIAEIIQNLLNRLVRIHKCLDLEWLRNTPPDEAKKYLLAIPGLGLKSVECVRLLSLKQAAFPVDTNVGRIAVRMGWVPLQPLPPEVWLQDLDLYPILNSIQMYLWPRLCNLPQQTLYELHCQMITFGKVFCNQRNPNCNNCPVRAQCKHYATERMRNNALPGPSDNMRASSAGFESTTSTFNPLLPLPSLEATPPSGFGHQTKICEPIVEEPLEPQPQENLEAPKSQEVEPEPDYDSDGNPIYKVNLQESRTTLTLDNYLKGSNTQNGNISKSLVALTSEAASRPAPKLRQSSRLRTEHLVYELPRNHILLRERRLELPESDEDTQYHLAIWTPGETADSMERPKKRCNSAGSELCNEKTCFSCNNIREQNANIVRGTLLIPTRVANGGRFPLNATYFQFQEVFADHETSIEPLEISRDLIYNLRVKTAYFGSSILTILKGESGEHVRKCFLTGIVCFRAFDRSKRCPVKLVKRFHCRPTPQGKEEMENQILMLEGGLKQDPRN